MEFKFSRSIRIYYTSALLFFTATLVAGSIYYWRTGAFNTDNISSVFEASVQIEELEKGEHLSKIIKLVEADRAKEAVPALKQFKDSLDSIDGMVSSSGDEYDKLEDSLKLIEDSMTGMVAVPEVKSIISIFSERVDQFVAFVKDNNWKTLTRISSRIQSRLDSQRMRQPGFYSYSRLNTIKRAVLEDIRNMRSVTEGSVLTDDFKNAIYQKLEALKTEVVLLDKYLEALDQFSRASKDAVLAYGQWTKAITPSVALNKIQMERNSQGLIYGVLVCLGFLLLTLGVSFPVMRYLAKQGEIEFEDRVINIIRRGIIPFDAQMESLNGSALFQQEIAKFHDYVHKRMSFGSIFQEAMPFASLLLDSNLNMIWANGEFYQNWGLEEGSSFNSSVTWDYLQKFTNLGEEDPVMLAYREGIAGIYQIQVKTEKSHESAPYEMYVTPVEYAGQNRIMVMFYPLRSIEETISEQTRAIITPVSRTIEALSHGLFDQQFIDEISSDFDNAGIEDVLQSFTSYKELVDSGEKELLSNVERLEGSLFDQYKLNDDLKKVIEEQGNTLQEMMESLKDTKGSIISSLELRGKVEDRYMETMKVVNDLFYEQDDLLSEAKLAQHGLNEQSKVFKNMKALRNDYRELREEINSFRGLITHEVNQFMVSNKGSGVEENLGKIREDIKRFDKSLSLLAQVMQQTDISLSKLELIMQQNREPDFSRFIQNFAETREQVEQEMRSMSVLSNEGRECEDTLVTALKNQFTLYKETVNKMRFMQELLADNYQRHSGDSTEAEIRSMPELSM